jgi:uncharacterized membrane protein
MMCPVAQPQAQADRQIAARLSCFINFGGAICRPLSYHVGLFIAMLQSIAFRVMPLLLVPPLIGSIAGAYRATMYQIINFTPQDEP